MAWLSVADNNEDLCEKLLENEVIKEMDIFSAFQMTDRGDFVPQLYRYHREAFFTMLICYFMNFNIIPVFSIFAKHFLLLNTDHSFT